MYSALCLVAPIAARERLSFMDPPEASIIAITSTWPADIETAKALSLGFIRDSSFREILDSFIREQKIDPK